jgi:hypothetical protein
MNFILCFDFVYSKRKKEENEDNVLMISKVVRPSRLFVEVGERKERRVVNKHDLLGLVDKDSQGLVFCLLYCFSGLRSSVLLFIIPATLVLLAFLRSDDQGPTLLQVSGGIQNARRVASLYNGSYQGTFLSVDGSSPEAILRKGYSLTASAHGTGRYVAVVMNKTRAYYEAKLAKYEEDIKALEEVKEELRKLDVETDDKLDGETDAKPAPQTGMLLNEVRVRVRSVLN